MSNICWCKIWVTTISKSARFLYWWVLLNEKCQQICLACHRCREGYGGLALIWKPRNGERFFKKVLLNFSTLSSPQTIMSTRADSPTSSTNSIVPSLRWVLVDFYVESYWNYKVQLLFFKPFFESEIIPMHFLRSSYQNSLWNSSKVPAVWSAYCHIHTLFSQPWKWDKYDWARIWCMFYRWNNSLRFPRVFICKVSCLSCQVFSTTSSALADEKPYKASEGAEGCKRPWFHNSVVLAHLKDEHLQVLLLTKGLVSSADQPQSQVAPKRLMRVIVDICILCTFWHTMSRPQNDVGLKKWQISPKLYL